MSIAPTVLDAFEDLPWNGLGVVDASALARADTSWRVVPASTPESTVQRPMPRRRKIPEVQWGAVPLAQRPRVERLYPHMCELLYGWSPGLADARKAEYALDRPQAERVAAKLAELRADRLPMSRTQLYDLMRRFRTQGLTGLIDGRGLRPTSVLGRASADMAAIYHTWIDEQQDRSTVTLSAAAAEVEAMARSAGVTDVPSRRTMERCLAALGRERMTFASAASRRSRANRPDRPFERRRVIRPGQVVEVDASPLDVLVIMTDGTVGRPDLQIAVDVATRTVCAALLRERSSKGADVVHLLVRGLTPWRAWPGFEAEREGVLLSCAERRSAFDDRPVIWPEALSTDRGMTYMATGVADACLALGISMLPAAPQTPTDKPHVERTFRTIGTRFLQHLRGYVGINPSMRGRKIEDEAIWTISEMQDLLDEWICHIYQRTPINGLRHSAAPQRDLTPNEMYALASDGCPNSHPALTRDEAIALLPAEHRVLQHYGVNFNNLVYDSPELHDLKRSHHSQPGFNGRVQVRYDPYRLNTIWVRDPRNDKFIELPWVLQQNDTPSFDSTTLRRLLPATDSTRRADPQIGFLNRLLEQQAHRTAQLGQRAPTAANAVSAPPTLVAAGTHLKVVASPDPDTHPAAATFVPSRIDTNYPW